MGFIAEPPSPVPGHCEPREKQKEEAINASSFLRYMGVLFQYRPHQPAISKTGNAQSSKNAMRYSGAIRS